MTVTRRFPAETSAVRKVRQLVRDELPDVSTEQIEALELMVSELAANAILHAQAPFEVTISRDGAVVRIEVTDQGQGTPAMRDHDPDALSGRGLRIIDTLASHWGVRPLDGKGKTVWLSLDLATAAR